MTTTRKLIKDDRGAIVVLGVFMACFLVGLLWYLMGIGDAAIYAQQMSQTSDALAFAGAVYHARGMNVIAMLNIIMAATVTILVGSKVLGELLRKVEWETRAVCNQPPTVSAMGQVVDANPGAWACPVAQATTEYIGIINSIVGLIDDYGDGMVVGLSRGQADVARDLPFIAQAKLTQMRPIVKDYLGTGAPLSSGQMLSASMDPPDVRLGLPVENEPFDIMCMRGHDLIEDVVLAAIAPVLQVLPTASSSLRVSHVLPFISSFPPAYCSGNGLAWNVDLMDVEDLCDKTLEEVGVKDAGSHPRPHRNHDYTWCPSGNWAHCAQGALKGNGTFADDDANTGDTVQADCEADLLAEAALQPPQAPQPGLDLRDPALKQGKRIYGPARNGDDHFQVFGIVKGRENFLRRSADGVWVAALNGPASGGDTSFGELKAAQAEFYYDQTWAASESDRCWKINNSRVYVTPHECRLTWDTYKDVVLWNMRWRARLRRLNEDSGTTGAPAVMSVFGKYLEDVQYYEYSYYYY